MVPQQAYLILLWQVLVAVHLILHTTKVVEEQLIHVKMSLHVTLVKKEIVIIQKKTMIVQETVS